jgi:hypothetical protein
VQDINGAAPSEAKQIISSTDLFQSHWDKIADGVNTLHNYCSFVGEQTGCPHKVSEITNPDAEQDAVEDWTLEVTSGDVSAQKTDNKTDKFTTTAKDDVEFRFKVKASGMESEVYSALLKMEEESPLAGVMEIRRFLCAWRPGSSGNCPGNRILKILRALLLTILKSKSPDHIKREGCKPDDAMEILTRLYRFHMLFLK